MGSSGWVAITHVTSGEESQVGFYKHLGRYATQ